MDPTPEYTDPSRVPICCESDPASGCCSLIAFPFIGGIQLSWAAEDEVFRYVDGWYIYRAEGEAAPPDSSYRRRNATFLVERDYLDPEIVNGVRYWYRLTSVTPAGIESLPTSAVSARADVTPPAPPAGLGASVIQGRVLLTWSPSPEPDFDQYNVYRDPPFPPVVFPRTPDPEYLDVTVEADSTYRYFVTAVDVGLNESAPSDTVTVTLPGALVFPTGRRAGVLDP